MNRTLVIVCLFALSSHNMFAQSGRNSRAVLTREESAVRIPPQETPAALKKLYSNLGKSKTDLYDDGELWFVSGPNSIYKTHNIALPFTPKSNSHVSQVQVAVQYIGSGANQVNLSIYGDAAGVPGTLLAGPVTVTNLPGAGCCTLAVASFSPLSVTGGTQYWVVADTPLTGQGSDFAGGGPGS